MNGIGYTDTPLSPSQEGRYGIHFSEFLPRVIKLKNRHCEESTGKPGGKEFRGNLFIYGLWLD